MSVIWLVEKAGGDERSAYASLMGDFAVRVFASLASLTLLARAKRGARPDVLVIAGDAIGDGPVQRLTDLQKYFGTTPVVVLTSPVLAGIAGSHYEYCLPIDSFRFSTFVEFVLATAAETGSRGAIRYRDVLLDFDHQRVKVVPGDDIIDLPLKEAQLLKMFLERPGALFSREIIAARLWGTVKVTPRTIDSHISRLRKRLEVADIAIESVYGGGYVLK